MTRDRRASPQARRGTVLLIVAGMSIVLLAMSLAFLMRMRSDAEEADSVVREAQARVMLTAALSYIQESARMGWAWDDPAHPGFKGEAYGWIDSRDGTPGPKDRYGNVMARTAANQPAFDPVSGYASGVDARFPAIGGRAARCPMYVMEQCPYATEATYAYNPLPRSPTLDWRKNLSYHHLEPVAVEPAADRLGTGDWDARFAAWCAGDPRARPASVGMSWFRCYRATQADCLRHRTLTGAVAGIAWSPAVFIITCGAGGTLGFRDWAEVELEGGEAVFQHDQALFEDLRDRERILWFACEWTPAQGAGPSVHNYLPNSYVSTAFQIPWTDGAEQRTHSMNFGGSFLWIERLAAMPERW